MRSRSPLRRALVASLPALMIMAPTAEATPADALRCTTPSQLVNGSFENPQIAPGDGQVYPYAANASTPEPGIGWSTVTNNPSFDTNAERRLEIWGPDSGSSADHGSQFAEMAMNNPSTLYQDIATVPGTTMRWRLAHSARAGYGGPDVMHLDIGEPGGSPTTQVAHRTSDGADPTNDSTEISDEETWGRWEGTYTVPADQTTTRFAFAYVSSTSGGGGGNWLDDVVFTMPATACDDTAVVAQDGTIDIDVDANDPGDQVVISSPTGAAHGSTSIVGGAVRYTPTAGYSGTDSFTYTLTDGAGSTDTAVVTVNVVPPPVATPKTSTGAGTELQSVSVTVAAGQTLRLLNGSTPVTTLVSTGRGTFSVASSGEALEFQPLPGYSGSVPAADYRIANTLGGSASSTYTVTVTLPAAPTAPARTSNGTGTAPQTATLTIPAGGSVRLRDGAASVTSLTVAGEGSYSLNTTTGVVTFTPDLGFDGVATPVTYRVTDSYDQTTDGTYTATVNPPAAPSAPSRTSSGTGTAPQTITLTPPTGGRARLYDGTAEVTTLAVAGEGTYALNTTTNVVDFTPVFGFSGTATAVTYRYTDAYDQHTDGTYTSTVNPPAGPTAAPEGSTGVGTTAQQLTLSIPTGGSVRLLDGSMPATTVTLAGQGTFALDPATGVVTFTPMLGFTGTATIDYRSTDAYDQTDDAAITASVSPPASPAPSDQASSGTGQTPQTTVISLPPGGILRLLDGSTPVTTLTIPGQGTFTVDSGTGTITFVAELGFVGDAPTVTYRVTDAYGHSGDAEYTPTVAAPPAPAPASEESKGAIATPQAIAIPIPVGGSITLRDAAGEPTTSVTIAGQGTYTLNAATGQITFTPLAGFSGRASAVRFVVTDAYGQTGEATFAATVEAAPAVVAPTTTAPGATSPAPVPAAVCTRTRTLTLHWTAPRVSLRKVVVTVDGRVVRTLKGSARAAKVTLKTTGPKRFQVQIVGTAATGNAKYVSTRDYRLCKPNYDFVDVKTLRLKRQR